VIRNESAALPQRSEAVGRQMAGARGTGLPMASRVRREVLRFLALGATAAMAACQAAMHCARMNMNAAGS